MRVILFNLLFLLYPFDSMAEIAVIVHPSNAITMERSAINKIFTGKTKSFPNGEQAVPINQKANDNATIEFNSKVVRKSSSQLKAYWSKLVFTGKGTPPKEVPGNTEIIKLIAANPDMVGYVDAAVVDSSVKVIATF